MQKKLNNLIAFFFSTAALGIVSYIIPFNFCTKPIPIYYCSLEKWNDTAIFADSDTTIVYKQAHLITNEDSYSGKYSLRMDANNMYALTTGFKLKANKSYVAKVWAKTKTNNLVLVASSKFDGKDFYINSPLVWQERKKGWKQIFLRFIVLKEFDNQYFIFYIWNVSSEQVFIDDFQIYIE